MTPYPGATPSFRYLQKSNGEKVLQVQYTKPDVGYKSKWLDIPLVLEVEETK